MLVAYNKKGELMYASSMKKENDQELFCPKCKKPVRLNIGKRKRPYFSHSNISVYQGKSFESNEGYYHHSTKLLIKNILTSMGWSVQEEFFIHSTQQVADLFVDILGKQIIIEIQDTPIGPEQIMYRTQLYKKNHYVCHWIINDKKVYGTKLSLKWNKTMLQFDKDLGYYLYTFDLDRECFILYSQLPLVYNVNQTVYLRKEIPIELGLIFLITKKVSLLNQIKSSQIKMNKRGKFNYDIRLKKIMNSKSSFQIRNKLYLKGYSLQDLPNEIILSHWDTLVFNQPMWEVLALIYSHIPKIELWECKKVEGVLNKLVKSGDISYVNNPFINIETTSLAREISCLMKIKMKDG